MILISLLLWAAGLILGFVWGCQATRNTRAGS